MHGNHVIGLEVRPFVPQPVPPSSTRCSRITFYVVAILLIMGALILAKVGALQGVGSGWGGGMVGVAVLLGLISFCLERQAVVLPANHLTPREALLQNSKFTSANSTSCGHVSIDLRTGTMVAFGDDLKRYYWAPGRPGYSELPANESFVTEHGVTISDKGKIIGGDTISFGEAKNIYPMLTEERARDKLRGLKRIFSASFAPILGIIIVRLCPEDKGQEPQTFYSGPDDNGFVPLPGGGLRLATGGTILPDGSVLAEALVPINLK